MAKRRKQSREEALLLLVPLIAAGCLLAVALLSAVAASALAGSELAARPTVVITASPGTPSRENVAVFEFRSDRPRAMFQCALDRAAFVGCTSPYQLSSLTEGSHTLQVAAGHTFAGYGTAAHVTWVVDRLGPELSVRFDTVVEATGVQGAVVGFAIPVAHDASGVARPVHCLPPAGATFPLDTTTVVCVASDSAGNEGISSFHVIVQDRTPPLLERLPNIDVEATDAAGAVASWPSPVATDRVSGPLPVRCNPASGSQFALGSTPVACDAIDAAGNPALGAFLVNVSDTRPPRVVVPAEMRVAAVNSGGATGSFEVTATDEVGPVSVVVCEPSAGAAFPIGNTRVTCRARDAAGNEGTAVFDVTVFDPSPPVITHEVSGRRGNESWFTSPVRVAWTVIDPESEITERNGCDARVITEDTNGTTLTCVAASGGGRTPDEVTVKIDMAAPAARGDYNPQRGYTLSAQDGGSGVVAIFYQFAAPGSEAPNPAEAARWTRYSAPFSGECLWDLYAYAVDTAGNRADPAMVVPAPCVVG